MGKEKTSGKKPEPGQLGQAAIRGLTAEETPGLPGVSGAVPARGSMLSPYGTFLGPDGVALAHKAPVPRAGGDPKGRPLRQARSVGSGRMESLVKDLLLNLGENPAREGLEKTPKRVVASLKYLTSGYHKDVKQILNGAIFDEKYDEMVVLTDIQLFSLCEHHLLPFYGKCHVAYIPDGKIVGLSKIPRLVDVFARRLQVQERLTSQIAECLMDILNPQGVGVVIEALHLCMAMRGVEKNNAVCLTSSMLGVFRSDQRSRQEFLSLINHKR